jgi:hypothetical protein
MTGAQSVPDQPGGTQVPQDRTEAVRSELNALVQGFFRAVSFETGETPPYPMIHQLFIADGRLIKNSGDTPEISTVSEFIEPRQRMVEAGELTRFREAEAAEITEVFGNIAHRLSMYEKDGVLNGVAFASKGVISTQFIRTPIGWRMTSMAWDDERPGLSIPDRYVALADKVAADPKRSTSGNE